MSSFESVSMKNMHVFVSHCSRRFSRSLIVNSSLVKQSVLSPPAKTFVIHHSAARCGSGLTARTALYCVMREDVQFDDEGLPVGVAPKGGATDVATRSLQSPFACMFEVSEASGMRGTGSLPPREEVPMPWEYRRQRPLTYTQNALYDAASCWTWDAFQYAVTQEYPLATLARFLLVESTGLAEKCDLDLPALDRFLLAVDAAYGTPSVNPSVEIGVPRKVLARGAAGTGGELGPGCGFVGYHNVVHACDVLQSTHAFLYLGGLTSCLDDRDALALLLAAIVHDVGHPGVDNEFLRRTESEIAHRYHGDAPLERHHACVTYALMRWPRTRFHKNLTLSDANELEMKVRRLVLGTDMTQHFTVIAKLNDFVVTTKPPPTPPPPPPPEIPSDEESSDDSEEEEEAPKKKGQSAMAAALGIPDPDEEEVVWLTCATPGPHIIASSYGGCAWMDDATDEQRQQYRMLLMTASLKAADLGHLARQPSIHRVWVEALQEEFWAQGDRERNDFGSVKSNKETHDRYFGSGGDTEHVAKATLRFFETYGVPLFEAVSSAMPLTEHLNFQSKENRDSWDPVRMEAKRLAAEKEAAAKAESERVARMFEDEEEEEEVVEGEE